MHVSSDSRGLLPQQDAGDSFGSAREQAGTPLPLQEEVAQRVQAVLSCTPAGPSQEEAQRVLEAAQQQHDDGRLESAIQKLMRWFELREELWADAAPEVQELLDTMLSFGCWLCVEASTWHLRGRRVARAFHYTRLCQRWLGLRSKAGRDEEELWLRLRYDCFLNAAELAQVSEDQLKALQALKECERVQKAMQAPPDPEAVYICLAEVLLQLGHMEEAADAALLAEKYLRSQIAGTSTRKAYSLLVALSLEQAAYSEQLASSMGPLPSRALECFNEAESAWNAGGMQASNDHPGARAAVILLDEMRQVQDELAAHVKQRSLTLPAL
mmetsp:Transcript_34501/g.78762  ORF Transcript_34501/g.78762 Transcript_34501/m.78762 type:complete len:327 (+) Transcript_34501:35-1015(+)